MKFRFYIPPIWTDHSNEHSHDPEPTRRRILDLQHFEALPFQKQIVLVAGTGFFLDGYLLFANDFVLPIVGYLYWNNDIRSDHEMGINVATLLGAMCGQLILGFLADRLGRKKVYGWELFIVIVSSVGISMASTGLDSMRITPWLVFFRFLTGVGVGAEYPITAVITSEFAPTSHRGRMLATVFSLQSLGQLCSALVAFSAVRGGMALDSAWRLVYGVAAVPAAAALFLRLSIPESPRYTFDVARNADLATSDLDFIAGTDSGRRDESNSQAHPAQQIGFPPKASWKDAKAYFITRGNWRRLAATAGAWMLLDLSFYGLGFSSPQIVAGIFRGCSDSPVQRSKLYTWDSEPAQADTEPTREIFQDNGVDYMIIVSVGAVIGSIMLIWLVNHLNRKRLQLGGFLVLALLFLTLGSVFVTVGNRGAGVYGPKYAVIVIFALSQFIFNFGPNGLTFMFPAEIFPTRYRCSCHGISAAAGKFGSVIAVIALKDIQFHALADCQGGPKALGKVLLGFAVAMLIGAVFAWFIPEVQYKRTRKNIPLEVLALGRQEKELEGTELGTITSETVQHPPANPTSLLQEASH